MPNVFTDGRTETSAGSQMASSRVGHAAVQRLDALAPLDDAAKAALGTAMQNRRMVASGQELWAEGEPMPKPMLILSGWVLRVRMLADGRRQILGFFLPGDMTGHYLRAGSAFPSAVVALTRTELCSAPSGLSSFPLSEAYGASCALAEKYLLRQITRLGRLTAVERITDLFLELFDRLSLCGLALPDGFVMPLTQETLADATGMTPVHANRMLQNLRRNGDITHRRGQISFGNVDALRREHDRLAPRGAGR